MAAQRGMDVTVLRPRGYDLHPNAVGQAYELAALNGGSVEITDDREHALAGAQIVYAKSWGSLETYGNAAKEAELRAPLRDWCVTPEWLARTDNARFMHCLPVRRNVVVSDAVLDGPASVVIDQAENRLHAQTALLESMFASFEQKPKARANARQPLEIKR
jgi:N-acetylornithine carbamoyltransferase